MSSNPAQISGTPQFFYDFAYISVKIIKIELFVKILSIAFAPSFILKMFIIGVVSVKVDQFYFMIPPGAKNV